MTKGFVEKEPVKRRMVNVVRGLKLYEDIFTETELSKLTNFVNELRAAGRNGELPGETFILYNQQIKGNKRELIQLGVPIFGHIKEESRSAGQKSLIEPIPALLQSVIAHLAQWHLISENRKPNGCIINYFDEEEYSQPFLKPPHLEQPILTIVLAESTIAFGRSLVCDSEGNYKGSLMLSLKGGSLLVMRGNSADMARHGMCPSPNRRVSITFFKTRTETESDLSGEPPLTRAVTPWKPGHPTIQTASVGMLNGYERMGAVTKWVVPQAPVVMLSPVYSMVSSIKRIRHCGTGVFLPWTVRSKKHFKHIPPRAIRAQLHELQSSVEPHKKEPNSCSGICIEGQWPKLSSDSNKAQTIATL